jgi:hypothetical protein
MASPGSFSEHGNLVKARKVTHACQQKTPDWRLYVEQTQRESRRLMGQVSLKAFTLGAFVYITAVTSLHSQVPPSKQSFEVTSVKPNVSGNGFIDSTPRRTVCGDRRSAMHVNYRSIQRAGFPDRRRPRLDEHGSGPEALTMRPEEGSTLGSHKSGCEECRSA